MEVLKQSTERLHSSLPSNCNSSLNSNLKLTEMSCPEKEDGSTPTPQTPLQTPHPHNGPKFKAYKLLLDPCLVKGATKLYRFDGVVQDDPTYPPVVCRDPRSALSLSRSWNRQEVLELPLPRFKIDADYVGVPPPVQVSITNLNDNVDRVFLLDLLQKFGRVEELQIYYHPVTSKHLGIARILFEDKAASKACVAKLHNSPLMGNILSVYFDPRFLNIDALYKELIEEKKPEPPPPKKEEKKSEPEAKNKHTPTKTRQPPPAPHITPPKVPPAPPMPTNANTASPFKIPPPVAPTTSGTGTPQHPPPPMQTPQTPLYSMPAPVPYPMPSTSVPYPPFNLPLAYPLPPTYNSFSPLLLPSSMDKMPVSVPPPPPLSQIKKEIVSQVKTESPEANETFNSVNSASVIVPLEATFQLVSMKTETEVDVEEYCEEEARSPQMDLDTRIKLLLKSNKSTPFGKFLNFNMSDSEEEEGDARGRFRGGFTIRKRKSLCISRSEIWQSENSEPEASPPRPKQRRTDSPPPSPFLPDGKKLGEWKPVNGVSFSQQLADLDQVSEDSEIELPKEKKETDCGFALPTDIPPTVSSSGYNAMSHPPMSQSCPTYLPPEMVAHYYQTAATTEAYMQQMATYNAYPQGYPVYPPPPSSTVSWSSGPNSTADFNYTQMAYAGQVPYYDHMQQQQQFEAPPPPPPDIPVMSPKTELRASTKEISMTVLGQLTKELKLILRRDCEKRLIEVLSFKLFESWCDEQVKLYKEMKEQRDRENKKAAEEKMNGKLEMTITEDALSGFGFRSISKLPSFKIHKKVVPPVVPVKEEPVPLPEPEEEEEEEENEKSEDENEKSEEENSESDNEVEHKRRPVRRLTLSSDESDESSSDGLPAIPSHKNKKPKEEKQKTKGKPTPVVWSEESGSEESMLSPKPIATFLELPKEKDPLESAAAEEERRKKELEALLERKKAAFEQALQSPLRPSSPERVSIEGPYVHTYDHNYSMPWRPTVPEPPPVAEVKPVIPPVPVLKPKNEPVKPLPKPKATARRGTRAKPEPVFSPVKPVKTITSFEQRSQAEQTKILTEFLFAGVDLEDIMYFKTCFENMKKDPAQAWITRTHWKDHPPTKILERKKKSKRRVHASGSARTEGFYHLDEDEKRRHKMQWAKVMTVEYSAPGTAGAVGVTALVHEKHQGKTQIEKSREARSQQRRILTALGTEVTSTSDLLKFNQLKFRKKNLCFRRSTIHDWGLFAAEPIAADEMVIEYVGQTIRPYLADVREQKYEKQGIGSSYLFRIDLENIIDATKCGNLSRFINHSCNPNCYAKVITIQGEKKIVIYSKEAIAVNEEITYDYKFPIEEKKIICLCGTPQCRGTLN